MLFVFRPFHNNVDTGTDYSRVDVNRYSRNSEMSNRHRVGELHVDIHKNTLLILSVCDTLLLF